MDQAPLDADILAAQLYNQLAPKLLHLLAERLDDWGQQQNQILRAMFKEIPTRSLLDQKPAGYCEMDEVQDTSSDQSPAKAVTGHAATDVTIHSAAGDEEALQVALSNVQNPHSISVASFAFGMNTGVFSSKEQLDLPPSSEAEARWYTCTTRLPRCTLQQILGNIVHHNAFTTLSALVMTCHGILIAHAANLAMDDALHGKTKSSQPKGFMQMVEIGFGGFYTIELVLRVLAERSAFWKSEDWKWNSFDVIMVAVAFEEFLGAAFKVELTSSNLTFLRLVRLLKLLKALRFVRIFRAFRELRLLIDSIFGCFKAMLWALLLLALITFMFGVIFVQACAFGMMDLALDANFRDDMVRHWVSVQTAMNTLFMAGTGGDSWRIFAKPLLKVSPVIYGVFLLYIAFFLFVVTNTLTSMFIESFMNSAEKDESLMIQMHQARRMDIIQKAIKITQMLDLDRSGIVGQEEFDIMFHTKELAAFMDQLDVDPSDVREFFDILSREGSRDVTIEQFVRGCMKVRGPARSVDLVAALEVLHTHEVNQHKWACHWQVQLDRMQSTVEECLSCLVTEHELCTPVPDEHIAQ